MRAWQRGRATGLIRGCGALPVWQESRYRLADHRLHGLVRHQRTDGSVLGGDAAGYSESGGSVALDGQSRLHPRLTPT